MKRVVLIAVAGGLALVGAASLAAYLLQRPNFIRVAVAANSEDAKLMSAAAQAFSKAKRSLRLKVVTVADSRAAGGALEDESVDAAVVRSDIYLPPHGRTVAILHRNVSILLAPPASKIADISALKGRTVGVVGGTNGPTPNVALLNAILAHYDVPPDAVSKKPLDVGDVAQAIVAHEIDAVFAVGIPSFGPLADVVAAVTRAGGAAPVFLPVPEAKAISQRAPALEPMDVLAGAFGGSPPRPAETFGTIGVSTRLLAHADMPDATASALTDILFSERPNIAQTNPLANRMEIPSTDKGQPLPIHPGTAAWIDDDEQTFFDKYSDFIYIGAMLLSVLGSMAAAVASRITARSHSEVEGLLERLLDILRACRTAPSVDALESLGGEADDILMNALARGAIRSLNSHQMAALGIVLDQTRRAIGERRDVLARRPQAAVIQQAEPVS